MDVARSGSGCDGTDPKPELDTRCPRAVGSFVRLRLNYRRAIYSLPTAGGIVLGTILGLPIYFVNWLVFRQLLGFPANELHAGITHLVFAVFFSVAYRAAAVPPPRRKPA